MVVSLLDLSMLMQRSKKNAFANLCDNVRT